MIFSAPILFATLIPLGDHVDVRWNFDVTTSRWSCQMVTSASNGVETSRDPDEVFLPLSDKPYRASSPANSGSRNTQPASAAYAFTGASPGSPLWIAPQGTPGTGESWPGLENTQNTGTFGEYLETDPRLPQPQTLARPWIKVALKGMNYYGPGTNPAFSMWNLSSSTLRVWMTTSDGISSNDFYLFTSGSHNHMNWGFTEMGIYRIQLAASAFRGPGQTNPTGESETRTLTFAVGPFAVWQAARFSIAELENPSISAATADPDNDGLSNLNEFALGTPPRSGLNTPDSAGLGVPVFFRETINSVPHEVLIFPRRKPAELSKPLLYTVEDSDLTTASPWQPVADADPILSALPSTDPLLNATWEIARIQRPIPPTGRPSRFFRLKVVQPD